MGGGARSFLLARARAGAAALVALAVIAAIAAFLVAGSIAAVRAAESRTLIAATAQVAGDASHVVVRVEGGDATARHGAVDAALSDLGVAGALRVTEAEDGLIVLRPDPAGFSGAAVLALIDALPDLADAVARHIDGPVQVSGALRATLTDLAEAVRQRQAPGWIAVVIVVLVAGIVVTAAATEPVRTRASERALLRARGMSKAGLVGIALREAAPVLVTGTAIGAAVGAIAAWALTAVRPDWAWTALAAALPAVAGLVCVALTTIRGVDRRSQRGEVIVGITVLVLLAALAALAVWQFAVQGTAAGAAPDPFAIVAPALVLAFAALVAVVAAGPLAAGSARIAARTERAVPVLPLRFAARRTARHALTTGAVAFAASTIVLAVAYAGTLSSLGSAPEALRVGADVRVTGIPEGQDLATLRDLDGVSATMAVRPIQARGADGTIPLLAVQSDAVGEVMLDADGRVDPAVLGADIALGTVGTPLPDAARDITLSFQVPEGETFDDGSGGILHALPVGVDVTLLVIGADGSLTRLTAGNVTPIDPDNPRSVAVEVAQTVTATFPLPDGGPSVLAGIEVIPDETGGDAGIWIDVAVHAGGETVDLSGFEGRGSDVEAAADGLRILTVEPSGGEGPRKSSRAVAPEVPTVQPVVMSAALAESLDVHEGSRLSLRMASFAFTIDVRVDRIVPLIPGAAGGEGVLLDLTALTLAANEQLAATELWMATADPSSVADAADAAVDGVKVLERDPLAAGGAAGTAVGFLFAAGGATALALVVLLLRRSRSDGTQRELGLLAALGLGRRGAARVRAVEEGFAVLAGGVLGAVGGFAAAWLVVPVLARAAYGGLPASFPIGLDPVLLVLVPVLVVVLAGLVAVAASVRAPRELAPLVREQE